MPFTFFKKKSNSINEGYKQYTGRQIAAGGGLSPGSEKFVKKKNPFEKMKDDFLMDIGVKEKDIDYYSRLDDRQQATQDALDRMREFSKDRNRNRSKGETAAEKRERERKEALEKLREEGRQRRIKFYKQKDLNFLNLKKAFGLDKKESTA